MVTYQQVSDAVDACLTAAGKAPDDAQVMRSAPYGFDDVQFMGDFLKAVATELAKSGINLDVGDIDAGACLGMTVLQLKQAIYTELTA